MSSHNNFKKDKCWSCEYFSGRREYKKGVLLGDSVYADIRGKCSNAKSSKFNCTISEDGWCYKYQKWGVLQSALAIEEQKKESERILNQIKKEQQVNTVSHTSHTLTDEEREEIRASIEEDERKEQLARKQRAISIQQAKINKIRKSPIIAGIVGGIITLAIFLLGWTPYWHWDIRYIFNKKSIEQMLEWGHKMDEASMQELQVDMLHAEEMRNSVIWIPFVILAIGIAITTVVVILKNKSKPIRLVAARKELEELKK